MIDHRIHLLPSQIEWREIEEKCDRRGIAL